MKLPHRELSYVPEAKILRYLLDDAHEDGGPKAAFFKRFGFTRDNWQALADALREHADVNEVVEVEDTRLGTAYVLDGKIRCPDGRLPKIRTVWFVDTGELSPRFVTA